MYEPRDLGRFAFVMCALLVSATTALAQGGGDSHASSDQALRAYYTANGLLNRGLYELAAAEYRTFLDAHADHAKAPTARYGLGVCLYRIQDYEAAITVLETLGDAGDQPYEAESLMILGQSRLAIGRFGGAVESFQRLLQRHPDHELADDAAALLVEALYRDGQHARAEAPCAALIERWPTSPLRERAELFAGLAKMALGDATTAAARFAGMRQRFPDGAFADQTSLLLAQCLHRGHAVDDAASAYQQVIRSGVEAYVPEALYGLAVLQHQQDRPQEAVALAEELLNRFPEHALVADAQFIRGRALFDLEEYDRAFEAFGASGLTAADHRDEATYWMAKCELRTEAYEAAVERLTDALKDYPDSALRPEMRYDLGVAQLRNEQPADAGRSLQTFLDEHATHALVPDAMHLLATIRHQAGELPQSEALCLQFRQHFPDHEAAPSMAFLLAENRFLAGNFEEATADYQRFLQDDPKNEQATDATYRLGIGLYRLHRAEEAITPLEAVVNGARTPETFRPAVLALGDIAFQSGDWPRAEQFLRTYVGFGSDAPAMDDALLKLGLAMHRQGRPEEALEAYDALLAQFQDSPHRLQALFERGQALLALGQDDDARDAFEAVVASGASRFAPHAHHHLGTIATRREAYTEAAEHFNLAAGTSPDPSLQAEALFQQGQALLAAGHYEPAAATFEQLLRDHRPHERVPEAAARRAIALSRQKRFADALAAIEPVQETYGDSLDPALRTALRYEQAWCLRELNRADDAALAYRALLERDGQSSLALHAMLELAELESQADRLDEAAALLTGLREKVQADSALAGSDLDQQSTYRLAVCQFRREDYGASGELFETFLAQAPVSELTPVASFLCGESLFKTEEYDRSAQYLQRVVDDFPDSERADPALLRLGECLAVLQRWEKSHDAFETYLTRFSDSELWFQAQFGLAWALENQGDHDEAIAAYRRVVDRHEGPTAARAQFQVGESLFAMQRYEEAVRELLKVDILYAYPEWSAAALYEAGRCFQALSDPVAAREQFEQVRAAHGTTRWARLAEERLAELSRSSLPGRGASSDAQTSDAP